MIRKSNIMYCKLQINQQNIIRKISNIREWKVAMSGVGEIMIIIINGNVMKYNGSV